MVTIYLKGEEEVEKADVRSAVSVKLGKFIRSGSGTDAILCIDADGNTVGAFRVEEVVGYVIEPDK